MNIRHKCGEILISLVLLFTLSGCSSRTNTVVNYPAKEQGSRISITFFGNKSDTANVKIIEEIISNFMKENPDINVSYESLKGAAYFEALRKRLSVGNGDDIFMVNHDMVLELKETGQLMDLSGMEVISHYTDQMLGQITEEDGAIYWVPTTVSVFGLYCNMDLLKKHGQVAPENLSQWESTCSYFLDKGITPIIANNDISLKTVAIGSSFYTLYQEENQQEVFRRLNQGEESLSKYLRSGFAFSKGLIDKGYVDADNALNTEKNSEDLMDFAKGNTPFMLTGAWSVAHLQGMKPEFDFLIMPYPILKDGAMEVINADTRLSMNANSRYPEESMAFIEYFTRSENIQKFSDQQASLSPLRDGEPSTVKEIKPLVSCYQSGRVVIGSDANLEFPIWDLTAQVSVKLLEGETLDRAMDWLDNQAEGEHGNE